MSERFTNSQAEVTHEYLVYDTSSFWADVGGYLGLLLGESAYSLILFIIESVKKGYRMKNIIKPQRGSACSNVQKDNA